MSKKISKSIKKIRVLCILTIFAISLCNPEVYASKLKEKYRTENNNYFGDEQNAEKYYDFLKKYNNYSKDVDEINVSLQNSNLSNQLYDNP